MEPLSDGSQGRRKLLPEPDVQQILRDLVQKILEVYMDDIITFAKTVLELSQRVETILARLKSFGITVNPEKVYIGMT